MKRASQLSLTLSALLASAVGAFAHQLDEYLQATLVSIEPERITLDINLTPGISIAPRLIALIDSNNDGVVSLSEASSYAESLRRDLSVKLDSHELQLEVSAVNFPEPMEFNTGCGIIQIQLSTALKTLAGGAHILNLANHHRADSSVYLINATLPKCRDVQIVRQGRNDNQSLGEIDFSITRPASRFAGIGIVAILAGLNILVGLGCLKQKMFRSGLH